MSEITLKVSHHPSGNRTLTQSVDNNTPVDCKGALFANNNDGTFYRAVAKKIADLHKSGHSVEYKDSAE